MSGTQCETQQREDETPAQRSSLHWSRSHRQRTQTLPRLNPGDVGNAQANGCGRSADTNWVCQLPQQIPSPPQ